MVDIGGVGGEFIGNVLGGDAEGADYDYGKMSKYYFCNDYY